MHRYIVRVLLFFKLQTGICRDISFCLMQTDVIISMKLGNTPEAQHAHKRTVWGEKTGAALSERHT